MIYVALLRGINVGGNSKVEMSRLKTLFEKAGAQKVTTYINSGNIIFESSGPAEKLTVNLEKKIETEFGFNVKVLIKSLTEMKSITKDLPDSWKNDTETKCDVMFLWKDFDKKEVLNELISKPEIDNVKYSKGAILWFVKRKDVTRSGMLKLVGTKLYKQMTIRNCNTTRKLLTLMLALK